LIALPMLQAGQTLGVLCIATTAADGFGA